MTLVKKFSLLTTFFLISSSVVLAAISFVENSIPAPFQEKEIAFIQWGTGEDQIQTSGENKEQVGFNYRPSMIRVGKQGDVFLMDHLNRQFICIKDHQIKFKVDLSKYFKDRPDEYVLDDEDNSYLMTTNRLREDDGLCISINNKGQVVKTFAGKDVLNSVTDKNARNVLKGIRFANGAIYNYAGEKLIDVVPGANGQKASENIGSADRFLSKMIMVDQQFYIDLTLRGNDGKVVKEFKYPTKYYFLQHSYDSGRDGYYYIGLQPNLKANVPAQDFLIVRDNGDVVGILKTHKEMWARATTFDDFTTDPAGNIYQVYSSGTGVHIVEYSPLF